jgi:hypothetical protein
MADNFNLKKFLVESKALQNLNPLLSESKGMDMDGMRKKIREMILAELSENDPSEDDPEGVAYGDYYKDEEEELKSLGVRGNIDETIDDYYGDGAFDLGESSNSEKIRTKYNEMFGKNPQTTFKDVAKALNLPEEEVNMVLMSTNIGGGSMFEAKKKNEEEVEVTDTETEEVPAEEAPAEETPDAGGGLEDVAADMQGTEGELMDHLMKAFKIAKGMNNEKLETQVGNTLKFFVSEYIGGGEQ